MNSVQSHPFIFFFMDDPLPKCFGQKEGVTFRSLLTDEPLTNKITLEGISQTFQNLHAELTAFNRFYNKLKNVNNREDFFSQRFIGKNKRTHTRRNNCVEFVFSQDGRIDACIIQNDGVRCVIILDVRISKHYDKADIPIHIKNGLLADRIASALDEREFYKTPQMIENDAIFRSGLVAYQNELLQSINTHEAKFEILLNTIDTLIFSNKSVETKISLFHDKLGSMTQNLSQAEQEKLDAFIKRQLSSQNVRTYHKELFTKFDAYLENSQTSKNDIADSISKIKISKTLSKTFLNQTADILSDDTLSLSATTDLYRIFNKIPSSHLYVLKDELSDIDLDANSDESQTEHNISKTVRKKQIETFLDGLIRLKRDSVKNIYPRFKTLLENCHREKIAQSDLASNQSENSQIIHEDTLLSDFLHQRIRTLSKEEKLDEIAHILMHVIIKQNPTMQTLLSATNDNDILNDPQTLGYQWFEKSQVSDCIVNALNQYILQQNNNIVPSLCEKYPFLIPYLDKIKDGQKLPDPKLHKLYEIFRNYHSEKMFDHAHEILKTLDQNEKDILTSHFSSKYIKTSQDLDVAGYILGTLDLIKLEKIQHKSKLANPSIQTHNTAHEDEKIINKKQRQAFINTFHEFYENVDDETAKNNLFSMCQMLNPSVINGLKTLPKQDIVGIFIRTYIQSKEIPEQAFKTALQPVILHARDVKKNSFLRAFDTFCKASNSEKSEKTLETTYNTLTYNDIHYIIDFCHQEPQKFENELMFLENGQTHPASFKTLVEQFKTKRLKIDLERQEKRLSTFKNALRCMLLSSDSQAIENAVVACQNLTREDIKLGLSVQDNPPSAEWILTRIDGIKAQNKKNESEEIKKCLLDAKNVDRFMRNFRDFMRGPNDAQQQEETIHTYIDLSINNIDFLLKVNQNDIRGTTFFKKLRKNKKDNPEPEKQYESCLKIINSFKKKCEFYKKIQTFCEQQDENACDVFAKEFAEFTQDGQDELNEILSEITDDPMTVLLLKDMRQIQRSTSNPSFMTEHLTRYLKDNIWLCRFYGTVQNSNSAKQDAKNRLETTSPEEYAETIRHINECIQNHISFLSTEEIDIILSKKLFGNNPIITYELKKEGLYKSVQSFITNPLKTSNKKILIQRYTDFAQNEQVNNIQNDPDTPKEVKTFLTDIQDYFLNKPYKKLKKHLGIEGFEKHVDHFLDLKCEKIITNQKEFLDEVLEELDETLEEIELSPQFLEKMWERFHNASK